MVAGLVRRGGADRIANPLDPPSLCHPFNFQIHCGNKLLISYSPNMCRAKIPTEGDERIKRRVLEKHDGLTG